MCGVSPEALDLVFIHNLTLHGRDIGPLMQNLPRLVCGSLSIKNKIKFSKRFLDSNCKIGVFGQKFCIKIWEIWLMQTDPEKWPLN